jgi:hypothetical protein
MDNAVITTPKNFLESLKRQFSIVSEKNNFIFEAHAALCNSNITNCYGDPKRLIVFFKSELEPIYVRAFYSKKSFLYQRYGTGDVSAMYDKGKKTLFEYDVQARVFHLSQGEKVVFACIFDDSHCVKWIDFR